MNTQYVTHFLKKTIKQSVALFFIIAAFATIGVVQAPHHDNTFDDAMSLKRNVVCLAQVIDDEARGEPTKGKIAVGHVVMNRVKTWNRDICEVVYHKRGKICQFSGMCSKKQKPYTKESLHIAYDIIQGTYADNTKGATYFHATYVSPVWSNHYRKTVKIGKHIFYHSKQTL